MPFVKKLQAMWMVADETSVDNILDSAIHNLLKEGFTEERTKSKAIEELEELISSCSAIIDELKN